MMNKERFYRWNVKQKKYAACQGTPVELIEGYEGFLYETKTKVTCYLGICGLEIKTEYFPQFCTEAQKEQIRNELVEVVRNILRGVNMWRIQLPKILEQNGISPRYDENGNVKPEMKKLPKKRPVKEYQFFTISRNLDTNEVTFVPQTGKRIVIEGEEFFLHKEERRDWVVTHGRSGAAIVSYETSMKAARERLKEIVQARGIEEVNRVAHEQFISKYGLSPLYAPADQAV